MKKIFLTLLGVVLMSSAVIGQISTYPHNTNFESEGLCGTSCTGSCALTGTWRNADQWGFAQAGTDWLSEDGSTPSTATGPDIDHTFGTASGKYCYVETSGCNGVSAHLVSDVYDFSALTAPKMTFWYHMLGATMGTMHVDVDTSGVGNWTLDVTPAWTDNVDTWLEKTVDLSAFASEPNVRIRIRSLTGTSFTSDMAIDDITVFEPAPYDLNNVSITAGGGCGNSVTTPVVITYSNNGTSTWAVGDTINFSFVIAGDTIVDTLVLSAPILPGDTLDYIFTNGYADLSGPSSVFITGWGSYNGDVAFGNDTSTVTTFGIPIITQYPYFEDFEAGQNGWLINSVSNGTWAFGTPAKTTINSAYSGANCFVTGGLGTGFYNDSENSYIEGPCFDFTNVCDPVISLKTWWNAEFSWDGMNITYSTDGGTTWNLVGAFGDPLNWYTDNSITGAPGGSQEGWSGRISTSNGSNGWVSSLHRIAGAGGAANVKIRINFGTDASVTDDGVAFDDIKIYNGVDLGDDQIACSPSTIAFDVNNGDGATTYLWSTGATTSNITASTSGLHSVIVTSPSCSTYDTVVVQLMDGTEDIDLGVDTVYCQVPVATLDAGYWVNATYLWNTGETTQTVSVADSSDVYEVTITTVCGVIQDTVVITVDSVPVIDLGADGMFCSSTVLDAGVADTYLWNDGTTTQTLNVTTSGLYVADVWSLNGCHNSDTVMIDIEQPSGSSQSVTLCFGETLFVGSTPHSTTGMYTDTLMNAAGCDSIVMTNLTVNGPVDLTVLTSGFTLTAMMSGQTYQWINCANNQPIVGETSQSFTPVANGNYACILTNGNCSDTTGCHVISGLSIDESLLNSVSLYPNPTNDVITISTGTIIASAITITDATGKVLQVISPKEMSSTVSLADYATGIYFVNVYCNNQMITERVVKN